eukprot:4632726-Amphidinium_carterae.1
MAETRLLKTRHRNLALLVDTKVWEQVEMYIYLQRPAEIRTFFSSKQLYTSTYFTLYHRSLFTSTTALAQGGLYIYHFSLRPHFHYKAALNISFLLASYEVGCCCWVLGS